MRTNNIKEKIKEYFFVNPAAKLRVREIERMLRLPLPSVIRYCNELKKEGILSITEIGSARFYTSDRINEKYLLEKRLYNLRQIYNSGLIEFLKNELSNPPVILFGSFARGEDIEKSDIDLYIETISKQKPNLEEFEKLLKRKIQLFYYRNLKSISNPNLANNIINGIILNNFIEVFK